MLAIAAAVTLGGCGARTGLGVAGGSGAGDAGPRDAACVSRTLTRQVPVASPWFDTGIDLVAGARLVVHATGTVRYGGGGLQLTDANGGNFDGQKFFGSAVLPGAVVVSLIGKTGGSATVGTGAPVPEGTPGDGTGFVGTSYDRTVPSGGRLFLGFNDQRDAFGDNSGAFTVAVMVVCE